MLMIESKCLILFYNLIDMFVELFALSVSFCNCLQRKAQPQRLPLLSHLAGRGRRWRLGGVQRITRSDYTDKSIRPKSATD
jgi:hypothetical protein